MTSFPRYAIYFAAGSDSALTRFGAELLGYDAYTGNELPFPADASRLAPDWRDVTADPRKYGFHATLKAPMALASDRREVELVAACATFAGRARAIPVIRPVVDSISGFIAVIPGEPVGELQQLAADCARDFDSFRAPLSAEDRARRKPEKLSERQRHYLDRWGYPYVMEEFRFHMTLTGRLDVEAARADSGNAAGKVCCARPQDACDRSRRAVQTGPRQGSLPHHRRVGFDPVSVSASSRD
ncbi:putative phosphonate metabolism protein [Bradyrhizobium sp. GM7.3]